MSDPNKHLRLARAKLSANCLENGLPGRESQFNQIRTFLESRLIKSAPPKKKLKQANGIEPDVHLNKTMFICGVPGTGKTATVFSVVKTLEQESESKISRLSKFKCVYVNGIQLSSPERIYCEILTQITGDKMGPDRAQQRLDEIITGQRRLKGDKSFDYIVAIVDELDVLYSARRNQSLFYNLFDWPTSGSSNFILIAIANAMDLVERFMKGKVASRLGWDKVIFESYTKDDLRTIMEVRLGQELLSKCFENTATTYVCTRVSRISGDARRCLDACRQAIDLTLKEGHQKVSSRCIVEVLTQGLEQHRTHAIDACSSWERLVLKSIVRCMDSLGDSNVTVMDVILTFFLHAEMAAERFYGTSAEGRKKIEIAMSRFKPSTDDFYEIFKKLHLQNIITWDLNKPVLIRIIALAQSMMELKEYIRDSELGWPFKHKNVKVR